MSKTQKIKCALGTLLLVLTLGSCNKSEIIPAHTFEDISYQFSNEGMIKSAMGDDGYYLLFEELSPLLKSPGPRYLRKTSFGGNELMQIVGDENLRLIDFTVSDVAVFVLYSTNENIQIRKYDLNGVFQESKVIRTNVQNQAVSTHDRGRLAVKHNKLTAAIRTEANAVWLYSLEVNDLTVGWKRLIEPENNFVGYGMTGGSYDTFEQLAHPYMVFLDMDEEGNAYVVVPALYGSTIHWHNQHFGEDLSHTSDAFVSAGFESDALVTKVNSAGERQYTVVAGSADPNECYGIKVEEASFYLYGRTAKPNNAIGHAWDAYVAKFSTVDGSPVFISSFHVDNSEIVYDMAETKTGDIIAVGSAGWTQNPLGYSVSGTARKLVAILDASGNFNEEFDLEPGARHNQVRTMIYDNDRVWFGGWENGPGTHTGDNDPSLVYADAFWTSHNLY